MVVRAFGLEHACICSVLLYAHTSLSSRSKHFNIFLAGGCSPFARMQKPNKQTAAFQKPAVAPVQQQAAPSLQKPAPTKRRAVYTQQPMTPTQTATTQSSNTSVFSRIRPAKHQRADKAFDTRQNQLYMSAHTQQPPQVFDLQRPLIV